MLRHLAANKTGKICGMMLGLQQVRADFRLFDHRRLAAAAVDTEILFSRHF